MENHVYFDKNGNQIKWQTELAYNRMLRDQYLESCGLSLNKLIELTGKFVLLQIHEGVYYDQKSTQEHCVKIDSLFVPLNIDHVLIQLVDDGLMVDFILKGDLQIPLNPYLSKPLNSVQALHVISVFFRVSSDDIWNVNEPEGESTIFFTARGFQPSITVECSSTISSNTSALVDNYWLDASIELPDGEVIGK